MAELDRETALRDWLERRKAVPRLQLGVCIRNLNVHGFDTSTRVQATALSPVLDIPKVLPRLFGQNRRREVQILSGINGAVNSGEMLLVLGRPGSGCTTFLKALAGDTHGISVSSLSSVNYEGISYDQMHRQFKGESIYLAELDVHLPDLTLAQTLTFAAATRQQGSDRDVVSSQEAVDVAALLNLSKALNTWMGNHVIRGVSGGEKRRTSIAEAIVGAAQLQCWDNSTRGLDSATAQSFIDLLRKATDELRTTVAMTLYQASETMYKKFDKVTLLYQGRQIYFGPVEAAAGYFEDLGFVRPSRSTTPDFLTSLTNPAERVVREGFEDRVPRSPDEFAEVWRQSALAKEMNREMDSFDETHPARPQTKHATGSGEKAEQNDKLSLRTSTYAIPGHLQIATCLQRAIRRMRNDPAAPISLAIANAILALVIASTFFNLPATAENMDRRAVLIFFSLMLTAFTPAFEVLSIWAQRPIVEKHARYAFYHPSADSTASMICDLPSKVITAVFFQITIYFMTHLKRTVSAFFIWFLFNFALVLNMSMWFRLLGSVARRREHTMAPSGILILLCVIYIGYVVPVPYMVDWLAWFRFVNPIAYAFESLLINEFDGRQFPCSTLVPSGPTYDMQSAVGKICPQIGAVSGEDFVQGMKYLSEKYSYTSAHLWRNLGVLLGMTVGVCILHLLAAEYIPAQRSKGDVLQFQKLPAQPKRSQDVEDETSVTFAQDLNSEDSSVNPVPKKEADSECYAVQQQTKTLHFRGLSYDVKTKEGTKRILNSIDGWVKPRTLTALMGATGAGKTTLLDVLAKRATFGTEVGTICVDGHARDASFQRKIGYVQQEDIHTPTETVREALEFSALMRQAGDSSKTKLAYVDSVIQLLEMQAYADAVVGVPGNGLNIEQRKRLTLAVELVAKPELLLFLDEPTSGMDSQTAWSICTLLRKLTDNGQAVLCTIHQPSSQLFCMFDRLLLLNRQGETVYFGDVGPNASTLIAYIENHSGSKCPPDANPADWVLEVTSSPQIAGGSKTWGEAWRSSPQYTENIRQLSEFEALKEEGESSESQFDEYCSPWTQQVMVVSKRIFQEYWRDPPYLYTKVILCIGMALLNGLSFLNTGLDIQGVTNILFSIFLISQLFSTLNQQIVLHFAESMDRFEARERRAKTFSWSSFLASNLVVELFWLTIASVAVFLVWYYPTGLWRNGDAAFSAASRGALSFVLVWQFCLWVATLSFCLAVGIKNSEVAIQMCTLCFWFSLVFCGVLVSRDDMPGFWRFMYYTSPLTYFVEGLAVAGLANAEMACSASEVLQIQDWASVTNATTTCGEYMQSFLGMAGGYVLDPLATTECSYCPFNSTNSLLESLSISTDTAAWKNVGYMMVYIIFNILATFGLYWLVRLPRTRKAAAA